MYTVRILKTAVRELELLDKPTGRRVVQRIHWLARNLDNIRQERLKGALAGFYKLRAGDQRIIYEILRQEKLILIHAIGHRREVYRVK